MNKAGIGAGQSGSQFKKIEVGARTWTTPGISRSLQRRIKRHFLACSAGAAVAGLVTLIAIRRRLAEEGT